MFLLRLLVVALYPVAFLVVLRSRVQHAAAAARQSGGRVEATIWAQSPRRLRVVVLIAVALLLTLLGKLGSVIGLIFAVITAPLAASGTLRLLTVTTAGLVLDAALVRWDELSGFTIDGAAKRLIVLSRDAARPPIALALAPSQLAVASNALAAHLPEFRDP